MNFRVNNFSIRPNFKGTVTVVGETKMYYGKLNRECDIKPVKVIDAKEVSGVYEGDNGYPDISLKDNTIIRVQSAGYQELKEAVEKEKETEFYSNTNLFGNYLITQKTEEEMFY